MVQLSKNIVVLFLLMLSCISFRDNGRDRLVDYYRSNISDYKKESADDYVKYTLIYKPYQLKLLQQQERGLISNSAFNEEIKKKNELFEFTLKMRIPSNGNREFLKAESESFSYEERVKYYSFEFVHNIEVKIDGERVSLKSCVFERDFGISPNGTFTLFIENISKGKLLEIRIDDQVYGSTTQHFEFDLKKINSLPKLKKIKT